MELESEHVGPVLWVRVLSERIDAASAIRFKDLMRDATRDPPARVLLDLARVDFLDSSGLGAVVAVMKSLEDGCVLELCGLRPRVEKVFRLTRMDAVFTIHGEAADVLSGLAGAA